MTMTDVQSSMQSLEEVPSMIASVGAALLEKIQAWPDAPPDWASLAATCVVLADVMAWRCEELREALREASAPAVSGAQPDSIAPVAPGVCAFTASHRILH